MQFLLIHGAGSSGSTWDAVARILGAAGHAVGCPDLPSPGVSSLADHVAVVRGELCRMTSSGAVLLAGHSYGGMVISEAAAAFVHALRGMVYFDAVLPCAGKSLVTMAREAGFEQLEEFGAGDHAPFSDCSRVDWSALRPVKKLYVQFTLGGFASVSSAMRRSVEAGDIAGDWQVDELRWGHHAQRELPEETARILLRFAESTGE